MNPPKSSTPSPHLPDPSRRKFMRVLGTGGIILAATALGAGAWVTTRDPVEAREPWNQAGRGDDVRVRALSYAILAPNPHNRQPWQVDLSEPDVATLYCDLDRRLPMTDPFDRQITIGFGCFMELFALAAAQEGYLADVELFPQGEPSPRLDHRPLARIRLLAGAAQPDPLFAQILLRRTNKEPYDTARSVPAGDVEAVLAASGASAPLFAGSTLDQGLIEALRDLTWQGHEIESFTPRTLQESIDLMRFGKAQIIANPDGIDLGGAFLEGLSNLGLMSPAALADPTSQAFLQGMDIYRGLIFSAMGYVWLITDGDSRAEQIIAGRAHARMHLEATARGLDVHPFSQALQEYEEMNALYGQAKQALGARPTQTVQMLSRIGYGPAVNPSPRWPAQTHIRNA
jgi:hypothetical protein